eukprot:319282-Amphidinium_carterae.1
MVSCAKSFTDLQVAPLEILSTCGGNNFQRQAPYKCEPKYCITSVNRINACTENFQHLASIFRCNCLN